MISFRFHVVSITAIFLAIAIGVVVGTTYVDGAVVDGLRNRIETVNDNLDDRRAENESLEDDLGSARAYIDASDDFAVTDRLTEVPVLLLATRGIEESSVEQIALLARRAGGVVPGVIWLEPRWGLQGEEERLALAQIVDAEPDDAAESLWSAAWAEVVDELTAVPALGPDADPDATATTTPSPVPGVISALQESGFLGVDSLDDATSDLTDLAGTDPSVLVVTGSRARDELEPMIPTVVEEVAAGRLPTVVADVHVDAPEAPERGVELAQTLAQDLRDGIVLVDNADQPEGWVATVLSLDAAIDGVVGQHFGYGEGADGSLPRWTPP